MRPEERWRLAAWLEKETGRPVVLGPHSALEFYTLGAVQHPILEVEAPLVDVEQSLRRAGWIRAGIRWAGPTGQLVEPRPYLGGQRRPVRIGGWAFHVPTLETCLASALEEALRTRLPAAWARLQVLWAAHERRLDHVRLAAAVDVRGLSGSLPAIARMLSAAQDSGPV